MDTKFSSAIHTLILVSEAREPMNSDRIASSVGTNASYIRKLTSLMKKKGIIDSRKGVAGFSLSRSADSITLLDIYLAVTDADEVRIFDIHQNPNDVCIVGANIKPVLSEAFRDMEEEVERALSSRTLQDCIDDMALRVDWPRSTDARSKALRQGDGVGISHCHGKGEGK